MNLGLSRQGESLECRLPPSVAALALVLLTALSGIAAGQPTEDPVDPPAAAGAEKTFVITREGGLGVITVTDVVVQARDITGLLATPPGVGFDLGVRFDCKTIAR